MAKARSRAAARRMKDKWKAKSWYSVIAPASFDHATIAETLSDDPNKLIDRVTEVSLQELTNDFRKSHYKLFFKIHDVEDTNAHTQYIGHTLTSDYLRRMVRRKRSKIEAVYDIVTRDGAKLRIKPFATTDRRIQNSQKRIIRDAMKKTITTQAKSSTLSEFVKSIINGKLGKDIYQSCKKLYPVKRIEIYKTQIINQPRIHIEEPKEEKPAEEESEEKAVEETSDEGEENTKDQEPEDEVDTSEEAETDESEEDIEDEPVEESSAGKERKKQDPEPEEEMDNTEEETETDESEEDIEKGKERKTTPHEQEESEEESNEELSEEEDESVVEEHKKKKTKEDDVEEEPSEDSSNEEKEKTD